MNTLGATVDSCPQTVEHTSHPHSNMFRFAGFRINHA